MIPCLFCGGDRSEPDHGERCDGRQGEVEARALYGHQGDVPYEAESDTSTQAAASIAAPDLARLESLVLAVVRARPRTCDAVEEATGLAHQTVSARLRGLVLRDRVVDSGERARTRSGRWAIVWQEQKAG